MKEMEYKPCCERELLAADTYKGIPYYVISVGTHPCAYINIEGAVESIDIGEIECHGGITYSENYLVISPSVELKGWFIGWDYAHHGDYINCGFFINKGKRHTTKEMIEDCKNVIKQILILKGEVSTKKVERWTTYSGNYERAATDFVIKKYRGDEGTECDNCIEQFARWLMEKVEVK